MGQPRKSKREPTKSVPRKKPQPRYSAMPDLRAQLFDTVSKMAERDLPPMLRLSEQLSQRGAGERIVLISRPNKNDSQLDTTATRVHGKNAAAAAVARLQITEPELARHVTIANLDYATLVKLNRERVLALRNFLLTDTLTTEETRVALGLTRQAISARVKRRELLALRHGRDFRFPRWQFDDSQPTGVVVGLREVLHAGKHLSDMEILSWLSRPQNSLGGRVPRELMVQGKFQEVATAAQGVGAT